MKFSELWLREWVNPAIDSDALSNQITMAGLEVDGVDPVSGAFNGVVVGEVVECAQHPNADKTARHQSECRAASACWISSAARQTAVRG